MYSVEVVANNESDEVTCSVCGGDFVELLGQDIEGFLTPAPAAVPTTANNTITPHTPRGQVVGLNSAGGGAGGSAGGSVGGSAGFRR